MTRRFVLAPQKTPTLNDGENSGSGKGMRRREGGEEGGGVKGKKGVGGWGIFGRISRAIKNER